MDALYSKYRFGIFLMFLFLGPIIVLGAKAAMESNSNKVADWLPEGFEETKQLKWFAEKFGSDELLMVSGFTDDLPIQRGNRRYQDNWGLSAQRALTVTRTLINQGMPADQVFAAAFGPHQPVVPNDSDTTRAQNRRVELTTVPRQGAAARTAQQQAQGTDSNG